ncbi:hypothetical protein [Salipiger mucosus]|uniref:Uncharacterized protein n=1 Tax=Salipiger mucosus DSM 16094 TaxID=1123237 RepID=S9SET3_9RHOB|nr:hypothetical protein [Salipiger mucosus]EPX84799.1 hypothetical protein Salmuc_01372 [Salipiger mucosus DSM 16094]
MTTPAFAETARIRASDGQWTAEIGYHPAEDGGGNLSGFTICDRLYGDSKQAVIDSARRHYPGISIDTVFGHLTGEDGTAGPRPGAKGPGL